LGLATSQTRHRRCVCLFQPASAFAHPTRLATSPAMTPNVPLSGITVIELGHSVAAPYACEILGDLGADVIKIEKTDGDDARKWAPPYWGTMSATFLSFNRNKRSVVVNLRDPAERERLRQLIIERADVVVQNLRPG